VIAILDGELLVGEATGISADAGRFGAVEMQR
jgi:hypothetical protein